MAGVSAANVWSMRRCTALGRRQPSSRVCGRAGSSRLRKAAARTKEALWGAIGRHLHGFTPEECRNYLAHCGYKLWRVLGEHRYEIADPVVSSEAGEQGDADVHHALGLRDHDRAPPEPGQPMPLAGVVPLDPVRLLLARIELSNRQQHAIDGVVVRTVQACAPARQPLDQALAGGLVTIPAFP